MRGEDLRLRNIYNRYLLDVSIQKKGSEDIEKTFLAKGYPCTEVGKIPPPQIYTDEISDHQKSPIAKFSIRDGSGLPPLWPVIEPRIDRIHEKAERVGLAINPLYVVPINPEEGISVIYKSFVAK